MFYADYVNIIEGSRSFFATNSKSYNTLVITGQDLRMQYPEGYSEPSKQLSLTPTVSTKRPKHLRLSVCSVTSHFPQYFRVRVHYPCSQAVFTGVQNDTRALSTQPTGREHGECVWYGSLFEPSFDNLRVLRGWENDREFIDNGGLSCRTHIIPMSIQNAFRPLQIIDLDRFHRGFRVDICWQYVAVEILILSLDCFVNATLSTPLKYLVAILGRKLASFNHTERKHCIFLCGLLSLMASTRFSSCMEDVRRKTEWTYATCWDDPSFRSPSLFHDCHRMIVVTLNL